MNLPRYDQFIVHLIRNVDHVMKDVEFTDENVKDEMETLSAKLHRLCQESFIAFPKSANLANNSPRFQEFLRIAIEK